MVVEWIMMYDTVYGELKVFSPQTPEQYAWTGAERNTETIYFFVEVNCA